MCLSMTFISPKQLAFARKLRLCFGSNEVSLLNMTLSEEAKAGFQKRCETVMITRERLELMLDMPGPDFVPPIAVYLATDEAGTTALVTPTT